MPEPHRVQRLTLRIRAADEHAAFELRARARKNWPAVVAALDAEFEALADDGRWLRLQRLELDLSFADESQLQHDLPQRVRQALRQALAVYPATAWSGERRPVAAEPGGDGATDAPALRLAEEFDPIQALEVFLATGRLPWYAQPGPAWAARARQLARDNWRRLATACAAQADAPAWLRLLDLLPEAGLSPARELVSIAAGERMDGGRRQSTGALLEELLASSGPVSARHRRLRLAAALLGRLGAEGRPEGGSAGSELLSTLRLSAAEWSLLIARADIADGERAALESLCGVIRQETGPSVSSPFEAPAAGSIGEPERPMPSSETAALPVQDPEVAPAEPVSHAGAVLLHPYLPRLFSACGIQPSGGRLPAACHERAAALLCYAVTGADHEAEFNLGLIRLLLGLSPESPLAVGGDLLEPRDREEVTAMLESFVSHWRALKASSVAGVQSAFLQRPGLLRITDADYSLDIERTGIDVLLDHLPFAYSIVKMPWMSKPIHVAW
jgi:hypothetical protein